MRVILRQTVQLVAKLEAGGLHISTADHFVIAASQMLIESAAEALTFDEIKIRLEHLKDKITKRTFHEAIFTT